MRLLSQSPSQDGEAIRVLVRTPSAVPSSWPAKFIVGDLLDLEAVGRAVNGCNQILHLAGVTHAYDPVTYHRVNVIGTQHLIETATRQGVKRIVLASTRVIHPNAGAYARSKQEAEQILTASSISERIIVRLAELYDGCDGRGIGALMHWMRGHSWVPVIGTGRYLIAPLHVDDAASVVIRALAHGVPDTIYTVTGPESLTYLEMIDRIAALLQRRFLKVYLPVWVAKHLLRVTAPWSHGHWSPDQVNRLIVTKPPMDLQTVQELGVVPRPFSEALTSF